MIVVHINICWNCKPFAWTPGPGVFLYFCCGCVCVEQKLCAGETSSLVLWGCCRVSCLISCCCDGWYHEIQLNAAHSKGTSANQRPRFLPAACLGNREPLFPQIRKTQSATQPLPISDIWHMCSDCLVLQGSFPCDYFPLNSRFVHLKLH